MLGCAAAGLFPLGDQTLDRLYVERVTVQQVTRTRTGVDDNEAETGSSCCYRANSLASARSSNNVGGHAAGKCRDAQIDDRMITGHHDECAACACGVAERDDPVDRSIKQTK